MICARCAQPIPSRSSTSYRGKSYHKACYEALKQEAKKRDAHKRVTSSSPERIQLERDICALFQLDSIPPLITRQLTEYLKTYTCEEVWHALRYFFTLQGHSPLEEDYPTIGIVPYVISESNEFFRMVSEAEQANRAFQACEEAIHVRITPKSAAIPSCDMNDL